MPRPLPAFRRGGLESAVVDDTIVPWAEEDTTDPPAAALPLGPAPLAPPPPADVVVTLDGDDAE